MLMVSKEDSKTQSKDVDKKHSWIRFVEEMRSNTYLYIVFIKKIT